MSQTDLTTSGAEMGVLKAFPLLRREADPLVALREELLGAYEQASHAWLTRVQADAILWAELAANLPIDGSAPEELETYAKCISQRMQITAEEGQRLFKDCQEIAQQVVGLLNDGWARSRSDALVQNQWGPARQSEGRAHGDNVIPMPRPPMDLAKLIIKLRWIGMEEEACRLQLALRSLPGHQRSTVSFGPFSTD